MVTLQVDFWDVGQGDCSVIRLPDDRLFIIDVGPARSPLVEWLEMRTSESIYGIALTHNDDDHAGCFQHIVEKFHRRIEHVFLLVDRDPKSHATKGILATAIRLAKRKLMNLRVLQTNNGQPLHLYGWTKQNTSVVIDAIYPDFVDTTGNLLLENPNPNKVSAILCLDVDRITRVMWAGDAQMATVAKFCQNRKPLVTVGPHHGAPIDRNSPSYNASFDAVDSATVFVSAGSDNRYRHPVPSFIEKHWTRGRRVCCSQIVHCDSRRVTNRDHLMRTHLQLGVLPPLNEGAVACRGPMRLSWNHMDHRFEFDRFEEEHRKEVRKLTRPYCCGGLVGGLENT